MGWEEGLIRKDDKNGKKIKEGKARSQTKCGVCGHALGTSISFL